MAKAQIKFAEDAFDNQVASDVEQALLEDEVARKFATYSYYTIEDRALANAIDGLQPVQRRIIFDMWKYGLLPDKKPTKSARVVGDTMGNYHPHGDSSIYGALVRLAQPHTFNMPLIFGQGNFGAPGIDAAASRYTECRLSKYGMYLVQELSEGSVPMKSNYDDTLEEPLFFPAQVPMLLINGTSGIAVGMASNMPPHNPREAVAASLHLLENQELWTNISTAETEEGKKAAIEAAVDSLMTVIPGPDFPTAGLALGLEGAKDAFMTGKGRVILKGKYHIEQKPRGKSVIVFTEFPYGVSPSGIVAHLRAAEEKWIKSNRIIKETGRGKPEGFQIEGITDINDFADASEPVRLEIEVAAGTNPEVVVAEIFKRTELETAFNYNNNCLVNGAPTVVSLPELLQHFLSSRHAVVKTRAEHEHTNKSKRLNIVEGLSKVMVDIDAAIAIIRQSDTPKIAESSLMERFELNQEQATAVLNTALRKLTRLDSLELSNEKENLEQRIVELDRLIAEREARSEVVRDELQAILDEMLDDPETARRTELDGVSAAEHAKAQKSALSQSREVADEPIVLFLGDDAKVYRASKRFARGAVSTTTLGSFVVLTSRGRGLRVPVTEIGGSWTPPLEDGERVIALSDQKTPMVVGTKNGVVYAFAPNYPTRHNEFSYMKLEDDDEILHGVELHDPQSEIAFLSSDSSLLRFPAEKVAVKASVNGKGMAGIKLSEGQHVISFAVLGTEAQRLARVATSTGTTIKTTMFSEYPAKGRGTGGVRSHKFLKGEDHLELGEIGPGAEFMDGGTAIPVTDLARRDASGERATADAVRSVYIPQKAQNDS